MNTTEQIAGHECNMELSKDGAHIRSVCVLIGPDDRPGFRVKDGVEAKAARKAARAEVVAALASDPRAAWLLNECQYRDRRISIAARYSCLAPQSDGSIVRRDAAGNTIGVYVARH